MELARALSRVTRPSVSWSLRFSGGAALSHIPFPTSGSYPARAGNFIRPLVDGEPAFRRICQAIEAATHAVWVTIPFIMPDFRMPDSYGSLFDVLDRAVACNLDVRVIFWRTNPETQRFEGRTFSGSPAQREMLRARGSRFRARWDRAHGAHCHHQKSWLIDAGQPTETAFVGGINLNPNSVVSPGHIGQSHNHDAYVELSGPSATDVHHNFVQRWNEASERTAADGVYAHDGADALAFPITPSSPKGNSMVQIQRTVHPGRYHDGFASPKGRSYNIAGGERSIFEQYLAAIDSARCSIYIENQAVEVEAIIGRLDQALKRGVEIIVLAPADPEPGPTSPLHPMASLGDCENFMLASIAGPSATGGCNNIYVHAKLMLIDDAWATIGSCNLHPGSLFGHTEMNVSFWDPAVVRNLRYELFAEHLDQDTSPLEDRSAFRLFRKTARENRSKLDARNYQRQGLAFSLDPATYRLVR